MLHSSNSSPQNPTLVTAPGCFKFIFNNTFCDSFNTDKDYEFWRDGFADGLDIPEGEQPLILQEGDNEYNTHWTFQNHYNPWNYPGGLPPDDNLIDFDSIDDSLIIRSLKTGALLPLFNFTHIMTHLIPASQAIDTEDITDSDLDDPIIIPMEFPANN